MKMITREGWDLVRVLQEDCDLFEVFRMVNPCLKGISGLGLIGSNDTFESD